LVCYISNNTYSASFDGAKDAAYTAKYGHPPEMKQGKGRGKGKGREGKGREKGGGWRGRRAVLWQGGGKGREGRGGKGREKGRGGRGERAASRKGWKWEGRNEREGGMGN